jgi:hypothetical protein
LGIPQTGSSCVPKERSGVLVECSLKVLGTNRQSYSSIVTCNTKAIRECVTEILQQKYIFVKFIFYYWR